MSDIADGILNGDFDEITGEYIGPGQGFPRSINDKNNISIYNPTSNAVWGVRKSTKKYLSKKLYNLFILDYGKNILNIKSSQIEEICVEIQKDFSKYMNYLKQNYSTFNKK